MRVAQSCKAADSNQTPHVSPGEGGVALSRPLWFVLRHGTSQRPPTLDMEAIICRTGLVSINLQFNVEP